MSKTTSRLSFQRLSLLVLSYAAAACAVAATRPAVPATGPATTRAAITPAFGAIAYYDTSCSRCHGPQGSFYGPGLGKGLSDAELKKIVDDMANGPGASPLKPDELDVETAYHRALVAGEAFLSVTEISPAKLSGEVMPESTITLRIGNAAHKGTVDGSTWSIELPAGTALQDVIVVAEWKGKKTELKLAEGAFSHAHPIVHKDLP